MLVSEVHIFYSETESSQEGGKASGELPSLADDRKTPWHVTQAKKVLGQREQSAVCPKPEQTQCVQARVQEGTETTRASQRLKPGLLGLADPLDWKVWGEDQQEAGCSGHLATWQRSGRKRAGLMNCGLPGWSVRKRRKAGAPFSQAEEVTHHQRGAGP